MRFFKYADDEWVNLDQVLCAHIKYGHILVLEVAPDEAAVVEVEGEYMKELIKILDSSNA